MQRTKKKTGRMPFQPEASPTLDEQVIEAIKARNIPTVKLETNEQGHIIIDKDKHPELYDWAVNDKIIIKKAYQRKTLKQRVEEFYGKDFEAVLKDNPCEFVETDWGQPVGGEIW